MLVLVGLTPRRRSVAQGARGAAPPAARDAQTPQPAGTGVIAGVVAGVDSGRAVRQARVILTGGDPRVVKSATTDDQGRFASSSLPAATFTLTASRPGYLEATYGQRRPGSGRPGTPIQLAAGQKLDRVSLGIPRGGVMTGKCSTTSATRRSARRCARFVTSCGLACARSQAGRHGTTDDRGIYRIPSLLPGEYIVVVTPRESGMMVAEEMKAREMMLEAAVAKLAAAATPRRRRRDAAVRDAMAGHDAGARRADVRAGLLSRHDAGAIGDDRDARRQRRAGRHRFAPAARPDVRPSAGRSTVRWRRSRRARKCS